MLLHCDGFDHYGTTLANMTSGGYAEAQGNGFSLTTSNPATGTHAMRFDSWRKGASTALHRSGCRKVLPSTAATVGVGFRLRLDTLPPTDNQNNVFSLRTSGNSTILVIGIQSDGTITVRSGSYNGTIIASSGDFKLTAGAYYHIEFKVFHSTTVGTVELRVDTVTRINAANVNTGAGPTGQVWVGCFGDASGASSGDTPAQIDDLMIWDTTGSQVNDFQGRKIVLFQKPDQDTAIADFTVTGAGAGYDAINDAAPDGDTSYISAASPGDISEFQMEDLPASVYAVAGVMLFNRARQTESGDANLRQSLVSAVASHAGVDNAMSETYTTRYDIFTTDPDTGAPMTPAAFNAMKLRYERTA